MEIVHSVSGTPIEGIRLSPGVTLRRGDRYDSTSGGWEVADWCEHVVLQRGCRTIWVRPGAKPSREAWELLVHLAATNYLLTRWGRGHWSTIPGISAKMDGRIDWEVTHQQAVQELLEYGLVEEHGFHGDVYGVSIIGREVLQAPQ